MAEWYLDGDGKIDRWHLGEPEYAGSLFQPILDPYGRLVVDVFIGRFGDMYVEAVRSAPEVAAKLAHVQQRVSSLFDAVAHGDDEHRAWLKAKIDAHFASVANEREPAQCEPSSALSNQNLQGGETER